MEETSSQNVDQNEIESIIDRLTSAQGELPVEAFEMAARCPREVTPHLIRLIEEATRASEQGLFVESDGHFFATYLLADFKATEAWPAVLAAISLPEEKPFELYEDAITQDFGYIIATLVGERTGAIDELISNRSLNLYVRWQGIEAYLYQIDDGVLTREEVIKRLAGHLEQAIENQDELAEGIVMRLADLGAESALPLIEKAFTDLLINPQMVNLDYIQKEIAKGEQAFEKTMNHLHRPGDLIPYLSSWVAFQKGDDTDQCDDDLDEMDGPYGSFLNDYADLDDQDYFDDDPYESENETTVRHEGRKVGRNEQCPCGSGRKFKKCCGRT